MVDPLTDVKTARYQPSKVKWTVKCKTCNLKKGNKNNSKEAVKQLQTYLNTRGWYNKKIDGDYGSYTEQAVKSFQTTYKLTVDGVFGPKSCNKLTNLLKGDKKKLATINKTLTDLNKRIKQNTYPYADENVDAYLILYNSFVIPPADETLDTGSETTTTTTSSTTGVSQGVVTGQKTITVNMMPSCSAHHDGYYRKQVTFLDKCPFCGSVGVLKNNPKGVYEGELTCGHCDADFCGWDGNDKMKPPRKKLTIVSSGDGGTVVSEPNTNSSNGTGGTTTTTTKTTNLASITLKEIFEEDKKLDEYLVHELTEVNTSEDASDLSHEATFKVRYTKERYKQLRQLRTCDLLLYRRGEVQSYIQGYLSAVKRSQQNNLPWIELTVTGYQAFLEQSVEFNATARKSELINKLCMMVGIHADLNLTGLSDDTYTIQTSSPETSSTGGGISANGNTSVEQLISIGNQLASKYSFHSRATGGSWGESYSEMKRSGGGSCFAWSGALWTECTKAGFKMRVVEYATSVAGNHRSVQYKDESGNWVDYPYRQTKIHKYAWNYSGSPHGRVCVDENGKGYASGIL